MSGRMSSHRLRMLTLVGRRDRPVRRLRRVHRAELRRRAGSGVRLTAYLPTSGDALGPASNVKYHGLVVGRVIRVLGPGRDHARRTATAGRR